MKQTARRDAKPKDQGQERPGARLQASRQDQWAIDRQGAAQIGFELPAFAAPNAIENVSELERLANLLNLTAVIMRKLAIAQARHGDDSLAGLADTVEGVADDIADLLERAPGHRQ